MNTNPVGSYINFFYFYPNEVPPIKAICETQIGYDILENCLRYPVRMPFVFQLYHSIPVQLSYIWCPDDEKDFE